MLLAAFLVISGAFSPTDAELEDILRSLTLSEKVGQMTQLAVEDFVDPSTNTLREPFSTIALNKFKVGSVLNTYNGICHPPAVWSFVQRQFASHAEKVPIMFGLDSVHGGTFIENSTLFPHECGIAATFNLTVAADLGRIAAYELRACSIPLMYAPIVDLGTDARWSRLYENFGEDPLLASLMGAALIRAAQGPDARDIDGSHVGACAKHFIGYGSPNSGKDRTPSTIPDHFLREYHLPAFRAAVDTGVATVMLSSGIINGVPVHSNKQLITDLLKGELRFDGVVVSDWGDVDAIWNRDHIEADAKQAVAAAINAGIDIVMPPYSLNFSVNLVRLVEEGIVPIGRIDDAVRRILRLKAKLRLWSNVTANSELFGCPEFERASYNAAAASTTLLKNEGLLPLRRGTRVLVTGPNADSMRCLNGGWSYNWQGDPPPKFTSRYRTVLRAIERVNPQATIYRPGVSYVEWAPYWEDKDVGIAEAVKAAGSVDVVVVVVGENSYTEKPGDLTDLELSQNQIRLVKSLVAARKPIVLVLNEGRPRVIQKIADDVDAIVQIYLPGNFGGDALADVLFGQVNPSGKLPWTYPRHSNALLNYWHKWQSDDYRPQWEFGFGLSYTQFEYSNLRLSAPTMSAAHGLNVSVIVRNTGERSGKEVVLLFTTDVFASIAPDRKRLRRFTKIELAPGEQTTVRFELTAEDIGFVNLRNKKVTEPGEFRVEVGGLTTTFIFVDDLKTR
jgi:beta-glucosidase